MNQKLSLPADHQWGAIVAAKGRAACGALLALLDAGTIMTDLHRHQHALKGSADESLRAAWSIAFVSIAFQPRGYKCTRQSGKALLMEAGNAQTRGSRKYH